MRCGVTWGRKRSHGGGGMRSITTVVRYWPTSSGAGKDAVFLQLQALLEPCGIRRFSTDGGGVCAVYRPRATPSGQGEYPEDRKQTHQSADTDQAARASHDLLFQNDDDARSGHRSLHESL